MQDPIAAAAATAFPANPTAAMAVEPTAEQPPQIKCPRCDSTNTKFCYYNNYNLSQPRHFCKNCRRYWTKGGALRNIPVGGGTRKNSKRSSSSSSSSPSTTADSSNPKRPTPDPSPSAIHLPPLPIEAADDKMLEINGSFSSLLQSTGQFGDLNFLDGFDSPSGGDGDGSGAVSGSDSGEPNGSGENPNPDSQPQQPAENFLGWAGGWPDLAIYTSPGSSFQ